MELVGLLLELLDRPLAAFLPPSRQTLDLTDQGVRALFDRTEETVFASGFVHPLHSAMEVDPPVEAFARPHDGVEEPGTAPASAETRYAAEDPHHRWIGGWIGGWVGGWSSIGGRVVSG